MMNRKTIKWISGGLLVTVFLAGGLWFFNSKNANASTISYITGIVRTGTVEKAVSATGTIQPINQYNLSSSSGGKITEIDVKIGDQVKSGQVLAKLDPTQAQQQVTQAQNGVTQAQLKLNQLYAPPSQVSVLNAQSAVLKAQASESSTLTNLQVLQSYKNPSILKAAISKLQTSSNQGSNLQDYVSNPAGLDAAIAQASITYQLAQADLNVAKAQQTQVKAGTSSTDIQLAQNQVAQAQTTLNSAQTTLNSAVITAPADGTITAINGQVGGSQSSSSSSSSQSSSAFISMIGASDVMQVVVPVNQVDIGKISVGQSADITLDAFSNQKFQGTVIQVSPIGTTQSGVTTFSVTINVTNTGNAMKSGMSANVSIIIAQKKNVVTVPSIAVHTKGSTQTVSLAPVGAATPVVRTVQIGLDDGKNAEVIQGLQAGDKVVTGTKTPVAAKTTTTSNSLSSALSGGSTSGFAGGTSGGRANYSGGTGGSGGRTQN